MITLLSPFAPLHPWLYDALNAMAPVHVVYGPLTDDAPVEVIDLRDLQTRAVVLSALAAAGYSLPWALGGIWSPLSNEQAGRVVAEVLRRVGEDPGKPAGVVPICVMGKWSPHHIEQVAGDGLHGLVRGRGKTAGWRLWNGGYADSQIVGAGPDTGNAGRAALLDCAMNKGALLLEQVTP